MGDNQQQFPQDWSEADKSRYKAILKQVTSNIPVSKDDYKWFSHRRKSLTFYETLKRRALIRRHSMRHPKGSLNQHYNP